MNQTKPMSVPVLIYDGNCGFCKTWIALWMRWSGQYVDYMPSQIAAPVFPQIPVGYYDESVVLVFPNGKFIRGADAVLQTLSLNPAAWFWKLLLSFYRSVPPFRWVTEKSYSVVARNRIPFSYLTYWLWGENVEPPSYGISRWIFLKFMAAIYFIAFSSLALQLPGLVGSHGILSGGSLSDNHLQILSISGVVASVLLFIGVVPTLLLAFLWGVYFTLSLVTGDFLAFQWDTLLLEMGFLALLFAPWTFKPTALSQVGRERAPSQVILFLFRLLLFKVIFFSGWVKLASQDPNWANLTAVGYHYLTQPLPTWVSWYAHKLPESVHVIAAVLMFAVELVGAFLIFMPRRPRIVGMFLFILLQLGIDLAGNYGFFGWQTIALSLLLPDDAFWKKILPKRWTPSEDQGLDFLAKRWLLAGLGLILLLVNWVSIPGISEFFTRNRIVNGYGVFAVMTTVRDEIIFEGSNDGQNWKAYELKWNPGDLSRPPAFVEPHMPRLDWQLWFAVFQDSAKDPWFFSLVRRLLEGSPEVLALFEKNPFPDQPPKFVRALRYNYEFTDWKERASTGNWWKRKLVGPYLEPRSL